MNGSWGPLDGVGAVEAGGNGTGGLGRTTPELVVGSLTLIVIIFMTISGNVMVILAVFTHRPLKKVQNYFLVSLAAADLCVATLVMPFHVVKFWLGEWVFGLFLCQAWLTFDILCCTSSILNLCAIAIDRYWAITDPIAYAAKRTLKRVVGMIGFVWVLSTLISVPPLIGWNDWSAEDLGSTCQLTSERAFVVYSASGSFYLPLCLMSGVYVKIFLAARKRILTNRARSGISKLDTARVGLEPSTTRVTREAREPEREPETAQLLLPPHLQGDSADSSTALISRGLAGNGTASSLPVPPSREMDLKRLSNASSGDLDQDSDERRRRSSAGVVLIRGVSVRTKVGSLFKRKEKISVSKEKKAAKTLAIIMGVFVLCWFPFFLMYTILPFCESCRLHPKVGEAITWLGYINSALNPIIYTIFNMDFRRAFEKFLCPKSWTRRPPR